ncbi:MAG: FHA domain-containing protein [Actinobacteria bacterium]|nr:FHA domain-containing protein [Actinomycetota bacterium]NCV81845.1 FHA domain-containing protein [Actinomycetota bacterium]NCW72416.1 FHA domain-containing protein [Actinomycetota bacterium]NCW92760.1 FHA domain-containing protein [Actinomycetota bacterium]NCX16074.1 FHA domain-containing protein [Actinomycetota bacterium]
MKPEQRPSELTTTLHLGLRSASNSPAGALDEFLATVSAEDRSIIEEIAQSSEKAMLIINRGSNLGSRFLVTAQGASIGRSSGSDVFLDDVTVSRTHAKIESTASGFSLKDSGSLNGTYVNNSSITEHALHSGDQIQIGKFHLLFVSGRK